jgi:hypothetical protein
MILSSYGFVKVGEWSKKRSNYSGITFNLCLYKSFRVIYSFVINNKPKYIGICDKPGRTLKDRMGGYRSYEDDSTNKRIATNIKQELIAGKRVHIYALRPTISRKYKNLTIDFVKGLENPLIEKYKSCLWNI